MAMRAAIALLPLLSLTTALPVNSGELLTMYVSKLDRAYVVVQVTVEADSDNRALAVTAEAPNYYRSSQIQLDGERAPRTAVFEMKNLPTALYEVTGTLIGTNGPKAKALKLVQVLPLEKRPSRTR